MPRTPDPQLEREVTKAAVRLLDAGGISALTLRAVAREAGTTTATIYERFRDREELLQSVGREIELELLAVVGKCNSVRVFIKRFLNYTIQHQHRLIFIANTFGFRLAAREPTPVYDALKEVLTEEVGVHGDKREQVGMAIVSLAMGTARMIIATGSDTAAAKGFSRTCQAALQQLLAAFSRT